MNRKIVVWLMLYVLLLVHVVGCQKVIDEQGQAKYRLDPNMTPAIESGAGAGVTILRVLSAFIPALLPVSTAAAGALAAWVKIRPRFNEFKDTNTILNNGAYAFVETIERLKVENPKEAEIILGKLEEIKNKIINKKDLAKFEAIIRGLRGLPPKIV